MQRGRRCRTPWRSRCPSRIGEPARARLRYLTDPLSPPDLPSERGDRARRFGPERRRAHFAPPSTHALLEGGAERMRGVDAEDLHLLRVERQFLEREHQAAVLGMAFDIGIELGGEEI